LYRAQVKTIAVRLKVPESEVVDMDRRLRRRLFELTNSSQWRREYRLIDPLPSHDVEFADNQELDQRREMLKAAIERLLPEKTHLYGPLFDGRSPETRKRSRINMEYLANASAR
jgi:RNA polymerase sigma-32 factor